MKVILKKFNYQYMEYEKVFLQSELQSFFPNVEIEQTGKFFVIKDFPIDFVSRINLLTYIESYSLDGECFKTLQGKLEDDGTVSKKQHTRYSTHGLHEYKGKFNPQIVRAICNYLGVGKGDIVLDPFDGSGTTLIECAHIGVQAMGTDINPMACFIANAKLDALTIDISKAQEAISYYHSALKEPHMICNDSNDRIKYLSNWIPIDTLGKLEFIKKSAIEYGSKIESYILLIASDLIRDYSFQEPGDLRIRRRKSEFPERPFEEAFCDNLQKHIDKIERLQNTLSNLETTNRAIHCDIKTDTPFNEELFDTAITSPPYATALPYIDTQRISLVWLALCKPSDIMSLEAKLIGSREMLKREKEKWEQRLDNNEDNLPRDVLSVVLNMKVSLSERDGFRKQAVPALMYRYFSQMKSMFLNVNKMIKPGGKYALVVGHNRTTLGEKEFRIDTPGILASLSEHCGWNIEEVMPLQTYKRYGINCKNAINLESLIILRKSDEVK